MKKRDRCYIESRMSEFPKLCADHGLRATHQRREIFQVLIETVEHPTVEAVYSQIKKKIPSISIDTVYRTLQMFEKHGLINRVQSLVDKVRYDSNLDPHHHFICLKCQKVEDFNWPEFDRLPLPKGADKFGQVEVEKVELRGICKECKKA